MQMTLRRGPTEGPQHKKRLQVNKRKGICEWHAKREKYSDGG